MYFCAVCTSPAGYCLSQECKGNVLVPGLALHESSTLQRSKCSNTVEIHNRITSDFNTLGVTYVDTLKQLGMRKILREMQTDVQSVG